MADSLTEPRKCIKQVFDRDVKDKAEKKKLLRIFDGMSEVYISAGGFYTVPHGANHIANVIEILSKLLEGINWKSVSPKEKKEIQSKYFILYAAALIHDAGMLPVGIGGSTKEDAAIHRKRHANHEMISKIVDECFSTLKIRGQQYFEILDIAWAHAGDDESTTEEKLTRVGEQHGKCAQFLARLLQFADLLDIGSKRVSDQVEKAGIQLNDEQKKHYTKHRALNVSVDPSAIPSCIRLDLTAILRHKTPGTNEWNIFREVKTSIEAQLNDLQTYEGQKFEGWYIKTNENLVPRSSVTARDSPEEQAKTPPDNPEVQKMVSKALALIFQDPKMKRFKENMIAEQEQSSPNDITDLDAYMTDIHRIEDVIDDMNVALHGTLKQMREEDRPVKEKTDVWKASVNILCWLLLLTVDDEWLAKARANWDKKSGGIQLRIPVKYDETAEIAISSLTSKPVGFSAESRDWKLKYERKKELNLTLLEEGMTGAPENVEQIIRVLYKQLTEKTAVRGEEASQLKIVKKLLKLGHRKEEIVYATLESTEPPLGDGQFLEELKRKLPELNLIVLDLGASSTILVLDEENLRASINDFFSNNPIKKDDENE